MSYNPFSLQGKQILITGASSGIGRATAIECSKLGASVVITARRQDALQETFSMLEGNGHQLIVADLSVAEDIKSIASSVAKLDGIVFNAGTSMLRPVKYIKESEFKEILNINMVSSSLLLSETLKQKKLNDSASVVFTASTAGLFDPVAGNAMYSASKGAVCAFAKNAALELASRKIRVNTVCPGMVNTKMIQIGKEFEQFELDSGKWCPLGRFGEPEEIAKAFVYLLSDASAWITGTNLIIDGGRSIGGE